MRLIQKAVQGRCTLSDVSYTRSRTPIPVDLNTPHSSTIHLERKIGYPPLSSPHLADSLIIDKSSWLHWRQPRVLDTDCHLKVTAFTMTDQARDPSVKLLQVSILMNFRENQNWGALPDIHYLNCGRSWFADGESVPRWNYTIYVKWQQATCVTEEIPP